jgi:hypothetical protein
LLSVVEKSQELDPNKVEKGGAKMIVKRGSVVSHSVAQDWGIGKVVEVDEYRATIRFNDGAVRKITSTHFHDLEPVDRALYVPPPKKVPAAEAKPARASKSKTVRKAAAKPKPLL